MLFAERSVALYARVGRGSPQLAHGRYALSEALSAAGRPAEALRELLQALPLFEEDRQRLWAGRTRCRMAQAMVALIRPGEAVTAAEDAAKRLLVPGGERWRADALTALGHAETALGRKRGAQAHWREALAVHEAFGAPEARELRALLRDKPASPTAGRRRPGLSRTADTARTGTALRDLTAAVRTLTDQLRLQTADKEPGREPPGPPASLHTLDTIESELAATLADFTPTSRPPRADLHRIRTSLETLTSPQALPTPSPPPPSRHGGPRTRAAYRSVGRRGHAQAGWRGGWLSGARGVAIFLTTNLAGLRPEWRAMDRLRGPGVRERHLGAGVRERHPGAGDRAVGSDLIK